MEEEREEEREEEEREEEEEEDIRMTPRKLMRPKSTAHLRRVSV